eukprot:scaffold466181_cov19-Prasinocladus_malaysianus.AAC.1
MGSGSFSISYYRAGRIISAFRRPPTLYLLGSISGPSANNTACIEYISGRQGGQGAPTHPPARYVIMSGRQQKSTCRCIAHYVGLPARGTTTG